MSGHRVGRSNIRRTKQAWHFAESLLKGERGGWDIFKTVARDTIRKVI